MRRGRDVPRSRPPWVTWRRGRSRKTRVLTSMGSVPALPGMARFGATQSRGSATRSRTISGPAGRRSPSRATRRRRGRPPWPVAPPRPPSRRDGRGCRWRRPRACARCAVDVTRGALRAGVHGEVGQAGQLVVGDEVPGEDDDVDGHCAFGAIGAADEHTVDAVASGHSGHGCPRPHRHVEADAVSRGRRSGTSACAGGPSRARPVGRPPRGGSAPRSTRRARPPQ